MSESIMQSFIGEEGGRPCKKNEKGVQGCSKGTELNHQVYFNLIVRRMRLQYIYYSKESEPHTSHMKCDWNPPVQPSVALETFYTR